MAKWIRISVVTLAALAAGLPAAAGEVTGLTTFTPGTPAKASEVNGNFGIVGGAVNDNHSRLTAAESEIDTKQDRVDGTCAAGTAMSAVAADGDVTCVPLLAAGAVAVPNSSFVRTTIPESDFSCILVHQSFASFFTGSIVVTDCVALAPVTLPHGATLSSLSCRVNDAYNQGDVRVTLQRRSLSAEATAPVFETPTSAAFGYQTISDDTADGEVVDNTSFTYSLVATFHLDPSNVFSNAFLDLAVAGCSISYVAP